MISDAQIPEIEQYRTFETTVPFSQEHNFERLVVSNDNDLTPIHRWFKFKEGFSHKLLQHIINTQFEKRPTRLVMLDPFCGSGTTVLSAQECNSKTLEITAIGIERNPFIAFVAETKCGWHLVDPELLLSLCKRALEARPSTSCIPELSSIQQERCISRHMTRRIITFRDFILKQPNDITRKAALLALAASIEPVSKVRKDGRALRIVGNKNVRFDQVVLERANRMADDIRTTKITAENIPLSRILLGDGRDPIASGITDNSIDLTITSPPYPNNIDYTEVYKLELWLLGFINTISDFYNLRHMTLRSHPIIDRSDGEFDELDRGNLRHILLPLLRRISSTERWRSEMLQAYFLDLAQSLNNQFKCLRCGGLAVFVVGNSLHGGNTNPILVATDLILAELAAQAGFEIVQIKAARGLKRRLTGNHFLRESLVVLRKPL